MLLRCWRISQGSGVKLRRMKYELSSMECGMEYKTREQFFIFINYKRKEIAGLTSATSHLGRRGALESCIGEKYTFSRK